MIGRCQQVRIVFLGDFGFDGRTVEFIDQNVGLVKQTAAVDFGDFVIGGETTLLHTSLLLLWTTITWR